MAFLRSRPLTSLETCALMIILPRSCSVRRGMRWSLSNIVFRGRYNLGAISNYGHNSFTSVHNLAGDLPKFTRSNLFFWGGGIKFHFGKDPFSDEANSFGGSMLEECWEKSFHHVGSKAVRACLRIVKNQTSGDS